ncbi:DNase I-like protein [Auriculariales sp. MPI-PUGE-AT-0066]|nr:DNase I-like protein [Auriculariales sp. MPI-PUGE-AT-0066]
MATTSLRCLTLNCWGLRFVSKYRAERLAAIGDALTDMASSAQQDGSPFSFIALQECWMHADFESIRQKLRRSTNLTHAKFFFTGALGAGLAIFSAYPIRESYTTAFALNGTPLDVGAGDWYVGKGTGSIVVRPDSMPEQDIEVFVTHFHAKGGDHGPESLRAHRLAHAWEMANLIRASSERGRWVIAMGDYNSLPRSVVMRLLREHGCLSDAWETARAFGLAKPTAFSSSNAGEGSANSPLEHFSVPEDMEPIAGSLARATREDDPPPTTPEEALSSRGVTADSPLNSWSAGKQISDIARRDKGKRLDYILYRAPHGQLRAARAEVVFTELVPGTDYSYSDHFGVDATLVAVAPQHHDDGSFSSPGTMSEDTFESAIDAIRVALPIADRTGRKLLVYFGAAVVSLFVLLSAPFWVPTVDLASYGTRALIFLGILSTGLVTWSGTTALYAGFIFGNWEVRALRRTIEELEFWRHRLG